MAENASIKELMNAEAKASKIISSAREERGTRLKQAKAEAEKEIQQYRTQLENEFNLNGTDLLGDDGSELEAATQKEISEMKAAFEGNKQSAIDLMVNEACRVTLSVPAARHK